MKSRYAVRGMTTRAGSIRFEVSGYDVKGRQHRKRFKSEAEAAGEVHRLEMADSRVINNSLVVQTRLTTKQVAEAERCFDRLPHGVSLTDAVDRIVGAWNKGEKPAVVSDALVEHLEDMKARYCSVVTTNGTRSKVKRFMKETGFAEVPIDQVTKADVDQWLGTLKEGSRNPYRLALSGLWSFAVGRKWCKINILALDDKSKKKTFRKKATKTRVTVLSVGQCKAMLRAAHADGKSLAWTAVAIFGGLRPESEISRLIWGEIDLRANNISTTEEGKTGHRIVEIHPTLKAWLKRATGQKFDLTRADLKHVKRAAGYKSGLTRKKGSIDDKADKGFEAYPADITRHTFGSFFYGRTLSYNETADQMGNSVAIVKRHYKVALPQEQVEVFWNLTPENVLAEAELKAVG